MRRPINSNSSWDSWNKNGSLTASSKYRYMTMVKESAVVIIALGEPGPGESPNVKVNLEIFKRVIPAIAKFAGRAVLVVTTRPVEVMSYITWRLSNLPSNRVIGTGTLVDTMRFQCHLGQRLGVANTSVCCMSIGAQGDSSGKIQRPNFGL
ncbi:hypothetical protein KQX54_015481 [Cotesia glomerata]|uniref:Lactate/malate dehydrogenase N-terminal domain-containing protein n=1 Tax=Cotesia glomerata TaxID=32391 RepID=A0AAV7HVQ0_COTGL|nr:hypothetical protein KQX54_015481 [Cotesia glomerata]